MVHKKRYFVDLFAGCGGLSLGLQAAGLSSAFAVEKSPMAAETYYHNFIERLGPRSIGMEFSNSGRQEYAQISSALDRGLFVGELLSLLNALKADRKIRGLLDDKFGSIDLVAGGPPCQGFSSLGRRRPQDIRNQLPLQFLEFIEIFNPKAVLMENVVGMRHNFSITKTAAEISFHSTKVALEETGKFGYVVQELQLNAMHYGVPQHRPRLFLLALRKDVAEVSSVKPTGDLWNSSSFYFDKVVPSMAPKPTVRDETQFRTVLDAIGDLFDDDRNKSSYVTEINSNRGLARPVLTSNAENTCITNHEKRRHSQRVQLRFKISQYLHAQGISARVFKIAAKALSGEDVDHRRELTNLLKKARFPAFSSQAEKLAENPTELVDALVSLASKKHSQRPLALAKVAPTVVSIPDDVIHPIEPRTMTVREQARIQSFPDKFEFKSQATTGGLMRREQVPQYTQVGNAVPPLLARELGKTILRIMKKADS